METPFELKYQEAREKLFSAVNEIYGAGVPFYMIETLMSDLYRQVQDNAKSEIEQARMRFMQQSTAPVADNEEVTEENESN